MTNSRTNPKVDEFLSKAKKWKEEFEKLRTIILDCELTEDFKWMHPCYTYHNKNIVLIHGFKEYCALLFHKGALLQDECTGGAPDSVYKCSGNIELENILKAYIHEAIEVEKAGLKVEVNKNIELNIPEELQNKFDEIPALKTAFEALTPGRQRAYTLYFSQAKQSKTRESRVGKYVQKILDGKGLKD